MLKVRTSRASKEAENKSGVVEGYLFNGYSKRKLYCLSETYEELARLYRFTAVFTPPKNAEL